MSSSPPSSPVDENKAARIVIPSAARERARYHEELLLNQFGKLLHNALTVDQICDVMNISRSTYYRWVKRLANRERKFMKRNFEDVLTNEMATTVVQFKHIVRVMNGILDSKDIGPSDKIEAGKLAGEAQLALLRVFSDGPAITWAEMPTPVKRVITEEYAATGAAVVNNTKQALPEPTKKEDEHKERQGDGQGQQ